MERDCNIGKFSKNISDSDTSKYGKLVFVGAFYYFCCIACGKNGIPIVWRILNLDKIYVTLRSKYEHIYYDQRRSC